MPRSWSMVVTSCLENSWKRVSAGVPLGRPLGQPGAGLSSRISLPLLYCEVMSVGYPLVAKRFTYFSLLHFFWGSSCLFFSSSPLS